MYRSCGCRCVVSVASFGVVVVLSEHSSVGGGNGLDDDVGGVLVYCGVVVEDGWGVEEVMVIGVFV